MLNFTDKEATEWLLNRHTSEVAVQFDKENYTSQKI